MLITERGIRPINDPNGTYQKLEKIDGKYFLTRRKCSCIPGMNSYFNDLGTQKITTEDVIYFLKYGEPVNPKVAKYFGGYRKLGTLKPVSQFNWHGEPLRLYPEML